MARRAVLGLTLSAAEMLATLQDSNYTEREGRVVLPVRADAFSRRGAVGGIIHDSSATGQTLYVEPQALIEDNNALREAQLAAAAEERRICS